MAGVQIMETLQKLKGKNDTAKVSYLVLSLRRAKAIANLGQVSHTEGPRPVAVRCRGNLVTDLRFSLQTLKNALY